MRLPLLLLVLSLSQTLFAADKPATLKELLGNTGRSGPVLLDQGYRGQFTNVFDEVPTFGDEAGPIEFTHAWFGYKGVGNRSAPAQAIAIGLLGKDEQGKVTQEFRAITIYRKTLPRFEDLKQMPKIKDFENAFGPFRGMTDGWGLPGESHSSVNWMAFTPLKDGSIRVVDVFLHTINKGHGWEIWERQISEGVFRPTAHPPKMEDLGKLRPVSPR